ncbi:hypothetical protein M074_2394 [Bacteroides fragilis str. DS-166]|nr:hypothetical protein M074_2394 [Bacteroides fragilis str. DS-166]
MIYLVYWEYITDICPRIQITQTKTDTKKAVRERSSPIFSSLVIRKYNQPFSFIQQFV